MKFTQKLFYNGAFKYLFLNCICEILLFVCRFLFFFPNLYKKVWLEDIFII